MKPFLFYIVLIISAIISGMGIGGGSIFIMLSTFVSNYFHKQLQTYNLILFIIVGIIATINNIKHNNFDKKIFLKTIFFVIIGALLGIYFGYKVTEEKSKILFYVFMLIVGIYEIISSIINIKKTKNNTK